MPRQINNYRGYNEANIRNNKGLDKDYVDRIKSTEQQEAHRKIQNREVVQPNSIMKLVGEMMRIQGGEIRFTEQGPIPIWHDLEKKENINELARAIIDDRYGRLLKYFNIEMDIALVDPDELIDMKSGCEMCDTPEPLPEYEETDDVDLRNDIDKRKIVNIITQGSAKNVHRLIHLYQEQIDDLDPQLFDLMDKLIKSNEAAEWMAPEKENNGKMIREMMNGYTKTEFSSDNAEMKFDDLKEDFDVDSLMDDDFDFDEDDFDEWDGKIKVTARAIDLVVLLHECVKGIYEVLGAPSLPENDEQRANDIMANTDTLLDEFEDLRYGPRIREDFIDWVNTNNKITQIDDGFERLWRVMASLPSAEFLDIFFDAIISKTGSADQKLDDMLSNIIELERAQQKYDQDLQMWEKDQAARKQNSKLYSQEKPKEIEEVTHDVDNTDEIDYSKMNKIELGELRDELLDSGDFETLRKISKYL